MCVTAILAWFIVQLSWPQFNQSTYMEWNQVLALMRWMPGEQTDCTEPLSKGSVMSAGSALTGTVQTQLVWRMTTDCTELSFWKYFVLSVFIYHREKSVNVNTLLRGRSNVLLQSCLFHKAKRKHHINNKMW